MNEFVWDEKIDTVDKLTKAMVALKKYITKQGVSISDTYYSPNFSIRFLYPDTADATKVKCYQITDDTLHQNLGEKRDYSDEAAYSCDMTQKKPISNFVKEIITICKQCDTSISGKLYRQMYQSVIGAKDENSYIFQKSRYLYLRTIESENIIHIIPDSSKNTPTASMSLTDSGSGVLKFNFNFILKVAIENSIKYTDPSNCLYDTFAFIICHEICHYKFAHNSKTSLLRHLSENNRHREVNIAEDIFINDLLSVTFGEEGKRGYLESGYKRLTAWKGAVIKDDLTEKELFEYINKLTDGNRDRTLLGNISKTTGLLYETYSDLPRRDISRANVMGVFSELKGCNVTMEIDLDPFIYTQAGLSSQAYALGLLHFIDCISRNATLTKEKISKPKKKAPSKNTTKQASALYKKGFIEGYYKTLVEAGVYTREKAEKLKAIDLHNEGV